MTTVEKTVNEPLDLLYFTNEGATSHPAYFIKYAFCVNTRNGDIDLTGNQEKIQRRTKKV